MGWNPLDPFGVTEDDGGKYGGLGGVEPTTTLLVESAGGDRGDLEDIIDPGHYFSPGSKAREAMSATESAQSESGKVRAANIRKMRYENTQARLKIARDNRIARAEAVNRAATSSSSSGGAYAADSSLYGTLAGIQQSQNRFESYTRNIEGFATYISKHEYERDKYLMDAGMYSQQSASQTQAANQAISLFMML
jgi:hypothetical protein